MITVPIQHRGYFISDIFYEILRCDLKEKQIRKMYVQPHDVNNYFGFQFYRMFAES